MIQIRDLSYSYQGRDALRRVSLEVSPGEHLAVIGANGSGKTTLARCLNGLLMPAGGTVLVDGVATADGSRLYDVRRLVGMVFQNPDDQLVATTVESEIAFGMENLGLPHGDMVERVDELLELFHLTAYRGHPPHQLSGGEKQRLAVAASLALRPRYLVLDEPTSLLDPVGRAELLAALDQARQRSGIATVHITQLADEAARADRVVVLHRGEVHMDAPAPTVFAQGKQLRRLGLDLPFAAAAAESLPGPGPPSGVPLDLESLAAAMAVRAPNRTAPPGAGTPPQAALPAPADAATGAALLETARLGHVYDEGLPSRRQALCDVTATVRAGRATALLGASGSGKTTLAQHLNGLLRPSRGSVRLEGADIWSGGPPGAEVRRRVGLIFQFPELQLFEETVGEDVAFGPRNLGLSEDEVAAQVERALDLVGLPRVEFAQRSPLALSGGERRRAAIAGVLAMDPQVLVLDEPTAGLDPAGAAMLTHLMAHLRDRGRALVLISHDMDLVAEVADDVIVLTAGQVALHGPARHVLGHPDFPALSGLEPPSAVRLTRKLARLGHPPGRCLLTLSEVRRFAANLLA